MAKVPPARPRGLPLKMEPGPYRLPMTQLHAAPNFRGAKPQTDRAHLMGRPSNNLTEGPAMSIPIMHLIRNTRKSLPSYSVAVIGSVLALARRRSAGHVRVQRQARLPAARALDSRDGRRLLSRQHQAH